MNMDKKQYQKFSKAHAPKSPLLKDCLCAFIVGGLICTFAEGLSKLYLLIPNMAEETAFTLTSVTLIFIAVLLTGFGAFDKIAKFAGAGTLVPITGFANSVASPAIDSRSEGYVLGVGAKIFTVCGPVILYGTMAGVIYGIIYYIISLI